MDDIPFGDQIAMEQDRRKFKQMIDSGQIDAPEMLRNAPIVQMTGPGPDQPGKIVSVTCNFDGCGDVMRTMDEFEEHLALEHLGLEKVEDD